MYVFGENTHLTESLNTGRIEFGALSACMQACAKGHIMQTKRETRTGVNKQLLVVKFQLAPLDLRSWSLFWPTALIEMINTRDDSLFF